jgi:hypothetical protein
MAASDHKAAFRIKILRGTFERVTLGGPGRPGAIICLERMGGYKSMTHMLGLPPCGIPWWYNSNSEVSFLSFSVVVPIFNLDTFFSYIKQSACALCRRENL